MDDETTTLDDDEMTSTGSGDLAPSKDDGDDTDTTDGETDDSDAGDSDADDSDSDDSDSDDA